MSLNIFDGFDVERTCIDRVVFVIYDKIYAKENHPFDQDVANLNIVNLQRSRVYKKYEEVVVLTNDHSSTEYRLKGSRTMQVRYNVIRAYKNMHNIKVDANEIIREDNFFPINGAPSLAEQIKNLYFAIDQAKRYYHDFVKKFWGYECRQIEASIKVVEFPHELYPASMEDIIRESRLNGKVVYGYGSQSKTTYFQKKNEQEESNIRDSFYSVLETVSINGTRGHDAKIQLKAYQKSWGLVRLEHTIYQPDLKTLFSMDYHKASIEADQIIRFLKFEFQKRGMNPFRYDRSFDEAIKFLSIATGLSIDVIHHLVSIDVWESSRENRALTSKLVRKRMLLKGEGDMLGYYSINPLLKEMLNKFEKKESVLPELLF